MENKELEISPSEPIFNMNIDTNHFELKFIVKNTLPKNIILKISVSKEIHDYNITPQVIFIKPNEETMVNITKTSNDTAEYIEGAEQLLLNYMTTDEVISDMQNALDIYSKEQADKIKIYKIPIKINVQKENQQTQIKENKPATDTHNYQKKLQKLKENLNKFIWNFDLDFQKKQANIAKIIKDPHNSKFESFLKTNENFIVFLAKTLELYNYFISNEDTNLEQKINEFILKNIKEEREIMGQPTDDPVELPESQDASDKVIDPISMSNCGALKVNIEGKELTKLEINSSEKIDNAKKIIETLQTNIKLVLKNLNSYDLKNLFDCQTQEKLALIKAIKIKDSKIPESDIFKYFPYAENLMLSQKTVLPFELKNIIKFDNLKILRLEDLGLINEIAEGVTKELISNEKAANNLEVLSFKKNNLNRICKFLYFDNLKELILSNNKISNYDQKKYPDKLPKLEILDLSNNNFCFAHVYSRLLSYNRFLTFLSGNLGLLQGDKRDSYADYLKKMLAKTEYGITQIFLDGVFFNERNYKILKELNLTKFKNSLTLLSLSFSNINDNDILKFLSENMLLPLLRKLNLSYNKLTNSFFDLLINQNLNEKYPHLKDLDVSGNKIEFKTAARFKRFVECFKQIRCITLKHTSFEDSVSDYMKEKVRKYYEKKKPTGKVMKGMPANFNEIKALIDNDDHYFKEVDITIVMMDLIKKKYTDKIKKLFPNLLERIELIPHFSD